MELEKRRDILRYNINILLPSSVRRVQRKASCSRPCSEAENSRERIIDSRASLHMMRREGSLSREANRQSLRDRSANALVHEKAEASPHH